MKLSLLLLVVLVSTAFASPYYLRRQGKQGGQQKGPQPSDSSGKQSQGDGRKGDPGKSGNENGGKADSDRKGKDACRKVLDGCMKDDETASPSDAGDQVKRGIEAMRRTVEELNAKADCMEYQQETKERKREEQTPAPEESSEEEEGCKALLEQCLMPEEDEPAGNAGDKRFLRMMAREQGGQCKEELNLESDGGDAPAVDTGDNNQNPQQGDVQTQGDDGPPQDDGQAARRNELRQLLRELYSRK